METLGQHIQRRRKEIGMTGAELGAAIGQTKAAVSKIENDKLEGGLDRKMVVLIANILRDDSILYTCLSADPVYRSVIPRIFDDLNHIRTDIAIIFSRLRKEMKEGIDACEVLEQFFENQDPESQPGFAAIFAAQMEQIIDVKRAIEILEMQLLAKRVMTEMERKGIYLAQHNKCIRKGHHKPEVAA